MVNLVTIAIDDLFAYDQFRDSFGVTIHTPNLDRLMEMSVNFENAYASVAICAPSRAATMSGKTQFETGVHDNFTPLFDVVDPVDTWPAMVRDNGYFATAAGKVFHSKGGTQGVQEAYSEQITITKSTLTGERVLTEGGKKWAYLGDDADLNDHDVATFGIDFLDRAPADQEFLLTLGFDHPHTAYFAPARYFDLYPIDDLKVPDQWIQGDLSDAPAFAQQFASQPRGGEPYSDLDAWKATVQGYLTSISHMDAQLGRFLDALEASEHAADTAILLYSDHGYQLGAKDHPVKFTLWEESAKAPLMLYHPDLEGGKTVTTPVSLMDIMPTVLDITGTPIPNDLTGQSLLSFATSDGEGYVPGPVLTSMYGSFAIRSGDFRYIRYQDGGEELYDLTVDPGQNTNLANHPANADLVARLRDELLAEAREAGALIDTEAAVLLGTDGADQGVASAANQQIALGAGDDAYFIYENGTQIVETADGGFDTVYYIGSATFLVPDNVEQVYATLPDNQLGFVQIQGNDQDNILHTGFVRGIFHGGGGNDQLIGGGWIEHEFDGGTGNDVLIGAKLADLLKGGAGDDSISGWNKSDQIFGGTGADRIDGGNDNDLIYGGDGNDNLVGANGNDLVFGGQGDDVVVGFEGDDRLLGGLGDDRLFGGSGADSMSGDDGNDQIFSIAGDDLIFGGTGSDRFIISDSEGHRVIDQFDTVEADTIEMQGLALADVSVRRIGEDLHIWRNAEQTVWIEGAAQSRDDSVVFTDGTFSIGDLFDQAVILTALEDGFGDQTITASGLDDFFFGHVGDDSFNGKSGDDEALGGEGNDILNGSSGNDQLFGGADEDELLGGNGDDVLDGGTGSDVAYGGAGADTYVYELGDGSLVIDDKGFSEGDRLTIRGANADDLTVQLDGQDLLITLRDGGSIRIESHQSDRGLIEQIQADDVVVDVPDPDPVPEPVSPPEDGPNLIGTDGRDKLYGTDADERLVDGADVDNMFGRGGADVFALVRDGVADAIKDFNVAEDRIDLSEWGVASLADLTITDAPNGKVNIRSGSELLSVGGWTEDVRADQLTDQHFVFATGPAEIIGTDGRDKLFGTGLDERIVDGADVDNLFGRGGADTFVLVSDGAVDAIKDFNTAEDKIDVSAWGVTAIGDLSIESTANGKVNVRSGAELVSVGGWTQDIRAEDLSDQNFIFAEGVMEIVGTDQNDKLIAAAGSQIVIDGAGKDALWGGDGADTFVLVADGVADGIKDWEAGVDQLDVSAWGASSFQDLSISDNGAGQIAVRFGSEVLSVTDASRSLTENQLTESDFLF